MTFFDTMHHGDSLRPLLLEQDSVYFKELYQSIQSSQNKIFGNIFLLGFIEQIWMISALYSRGRNLLE